VTGPTPPRVTAEGTVTLHHVELQLALTLPPGRIVGIVGPNGAGKSVTLRTLVGLHRLTRGCITVEGRTVDDGLRVTPPYQRHLGWVPQTIGLLPRRRALAQVRAFARPDTPLADTSSPSELLTALGIDPADRRRPERLSGGQGQRVAVARAVAAAATVLLDEPLSAQDPLSAARVRALLRSHATAGGAVAIVAHRPEDAYLLADELIVLEAGRVVQRGTPLELAAVPATPYVAQVVGATVLEGDVDRSGTMTGPWGQLVVPDGTAVGPAVAVVRPATVVVATDPPTHSSSRNVLAGTVRSIREAADGLVVAIDSRPPLVAALTHAAARDLSLAVGRTVWATVKASEVDVQPR
jgi:molybdopterin-binding protein